MKDKDCDLSDFPKNRQAIIACSEKRNLEQKTALEAWAIVVAIYEYS
jgi:hypothetical protein